MFGYLIVNPKTLSKADQRTYRQAYCGLCRCLQQTAGTAGRKTLSYDLTFVALLVTAVYDLPVDAAKESCPLHPLVPHDLFTSDGFPFAADMNLLLRYYKELDDAQDDHDARAEKRARQLRPQLAGIRQRFPRQTAVIEQCLADNGVMEQHNELNPDLPANCFGTLFSAVVDYDPADDSAKAQTLRRFGFQLGKFIYLMDACLDLKDDIRAQRYNPLVRLDLADTRGMLELVMADAAAEYEKLPLPRYRAILDSVVYSGIWSRYVLKMKPKKEDIADEGSL